MEVKDDPKVNESLENFWHSADMTELTHRCRNYDTQIQLDRSVKEKTIFLITYNDKANREE